MSKKQTAVEWLVKEIEEKHNFRFGNFYWAEITQALAMEREQIEQAYFDGIDLSIMFTKSSEYYEQRYGKEASDEKQG